METLQLIGQLDFSHAVINRNFEGVPAPLGAAIVQLPDDEALMRQDLVPVGAGPGIGHALRAGSAVHHHDRRVFFARAKVGGLDEPRVEQRARGILETDDFARQHLVFIGQAVIGGAIHRPFRAIDRAQRAAGGFGQAGESIHVIPSVRTHGYGVGTGALADSNAILAVQLYGIQLALSGLTSLETK